MLLTSGDFVIRDLGLGDVAAIAWHANDPLVSRSLRDLFPHPYSEDDAKDFISRISGEDSPTAFAIASAQEAFGVVGYIPGQDVYRYSAEIGFWIGREYWGQGIMTGVVSVFSEYLFENFEFNRLYAGVFSSNPASSRVLEKAGFSLEGTSKSHVTKNGELLDELMYARLRPERSDS